MNVETWDVMWAREGEQRKVFLEEARENVKNTA